jgi:hypothetical protein
MTVRTSCLGRLDIGSGAIDADDRLDTEAPERLESSWDHRGAAGVKRLVVRHDVAKTGMATSGGLTNPRPNGGRRRLGCHLNGR